MNNNELHQVQSAIDQTHAPNISQSKRVGLYEFLEVQTSNPHKCKQLGYYFINFNEDRYRLFGYHCIRKMIEQWSSLDLKDKNDLKHLSLNLFKFSMNQNKSSNANFALLKKKISELIVTLATRCWPHDWCNLLPDLFKISQQNPMSLEMLFIVLKELYFIVDQPQSNMIPDKRKKQIKNELMKNSKQIIQIFAVTLAQCYQQIFASSSTQSVQMKLAQNILARCLSAIPKYLNQFPLIVIIDSQVLIGLAKILQTVAQNTNNSVPHCYDEFYRFSLLSIQFFFMRKFSELNTYEISDRKKQEHTILTVWNIEMEIVKNLYTLSHRNNSNKNSVAVTRLDNMMESMMRKLKLFHGLLKKTEDEKNKSLSKNIRDIFLGISECSMKSSHLQIRLRSMTIWSFILSEHDMLELVGYDENKHRYSQSAQFNSVIIGIMKYVLNHFRVRFHDLKSFETEQEWQNSRNILKTKIARLLQQCFVLCPLSGMECIGQFTLSILNCAKDNVHINSLGHATIENERYVALNGLCDVYRLIFEGSIYYKHNAQNAKKKKRPNQLQIDEELFDNNSPLLQMVEQLHNILLNWTNDTQHNANDTQLMSRIYILLAHLVPLYCRKPAYLQSTFEKLLNEFPKPLPLNPHAEDSFDIKCNAVSCKRKIAFSLLHIAKRIPHICVQFMQPIWKKVMQIIKANFSTFKSINNGVHRVQHTTCGSGVVMASITDLSQGPVCHLFELLVCISNGLQNAQQKSKVLAELLGDVIANFNSSEIQNVLSDETQFSKMIQFPMTPKLQQSNNEKKQLVGEEVDERIRFAYHIRTILNIIQSTLTASLLSEGQTALRDLFHSANLSADQRSADLSCSFPLFSAVFPNVLKLNKLLSAMYTREFRSLLAPNYHSIIDCLDVKSLYNLYGLKHDELVRKPTEKPKEIIPLEKAVIWIQNVRDYLCRIIAVASYFDGHFFEHENAMNMMIESLTCHWNELPLSHLAIILKHFFMNFVQLCSPNYYPNIMPFLFEFFSGCFRKLNACWAKQVNAFGINSNQKSTALKAEPDALSDKQKSSGLRNECFEEFALRDASQKLWMAIAMMTINHKERGFILLTAADNKKSSKNVKAAGNDENKDKNIKLEQFLTSNDFLQYKIEDINDCAADKKEKEEIIALKQDKLVMLMLQNENVCKCLLRGIQCSLDWLDNNCHIRVAQVGAKIVSFIAKYKMQHLYHQCGVIFGATLNALSRNQIGDNQTNAELNILCVAICKSLAPLCSDIFLQILQNVPNVTQEDTRNLIQIFTSDPNAHTNASYRHCIKSFTKKYVIGKQNVLSTMSVIKKEASSSSMTTIKREPRGGHY